MGSCERTNVRRVTVHNENCASNPRYHGCHPYCYIEGKVGCCSQSCFGIRHPLAVHLTTQCFSDAPSPDLPSFSAADSAGIKTFFSSRSFASSPL